MPTDRLQAEHNASHELRELVGTPWVLGGIDPRPEARGGQGGIDCIGLMVLAYDAIGRHLAEPEAWRFPIPLGYPYPAELPGGGWMPAEDLAEWALHFDSVGRPAFGLGVSFLEDHVGVLLHRVRGPGFDCLHSHKTHDTVLHPLERIARYATGYYRLRPLAARPKRENEPRSGAELAAGGEVRP